MTIIRYESREGATGTLLFQETDMKVIAAAMLGGLMLLAGPSLAQDRNKDMSSHKDMSGMAGMRDDRADAPAPHHMARHTSYKRNYKSDREEEQQTEALNRQYRGMDKSDMH